MRLYLLALNPTDSVTEGFLPAAARLGLDVTVLTDQPEAHRRVYPDIEILECDVRDFRAVITRISTHHRPDAVFTNSDHLQTQAALAADYFGLPGKDWRAALRAKDKAEMRRHLAAAGVDTVWSAELAAGQDPARRSPPSTLPYPCVVKPREGVASEDVVLVDERRGAGAALPRRSARGGRGAALVVEEYLPGELYTLETLGDGHVRHVLGGFHTELSPPPYFIEERLDLRPGPPRAGRRRRSWPNWTRSASGSAPATPSSSCTRAGPASSRSTTAPSATSATCCSPSCSDIPLFEHILRTHLGEPLPADLGARTDGAARLEYPCADRAGTLTAAPAATELTVDGVRADVPAAARGRASGTSCTAPTATTSASLRATGTDQETVDRVVADFLAAQRWEIPP